jgi:hypothetical protein
LLSLPYREIYRAEVVKIICPLHIKTERIKMYKVTAYSFWFLPEEYWTESKEEAEEIAIDLKNQQYSVDIEYIDEGD